MAKKIGIEEELVIMNWLEKGEQIVKYAIMLDSLILAYVQFMTMLIKLQKALSQEVKHLSSKTTTVLSEWMVTTSYGCESLTFLLPKK